MFFYKKRKDILKTIWLEKEKKKMIKIKKRTLQKNSLLMLLLVGFIFLNNQVFANIALPFQDTLDFGLGLTKTIGGTIAIVGLVSAFVLHKQGRGNSAIETGVWFFLLGGLIANLDWLADKVGITSGALFI